MRILITAFTLFSCLLACSPNHQDNESTKVNFSGVARNSKADKIALQDQYRDTVAVVSLDSAKAFAFQLQLDSGYYFLMVDDQYTRLYLKPGLDLTVDLDVGNIDFDIHYSGDGSVENNYLSSKAVNDVNEAGLQLAFLDEGSFLRKVDSLERLRAKRLNAIKSEANPFFFYLEQESIKYQSLAQLCRYELYHGSFIGNRDFKVSANYPQLWEKFEIENEHLAQLPSYQFATFELFNRLNRARRSLEDTTDYYCDYLRLIQDSVNNLAVKSRLAFYIGKRLYHRSKKQDTLFSLLQEMVTDNRQAAIVDENYQKILRTRKGMPSPLFTFLDSSNSKVSLSSLRGKPTYIDIWATWCGPCIIEMPNMEKLQEEFLEEEINFVSICYADNKESWMNALELYHPSGIQLFAEDVLDPFFTTYSVNGVPRFILLDRELKIVDSDAKRPSSKELRRKMRELLEENSI